MGTFGARTTPQIRLLPRQRILQPAHAVAADLWSEDPQDHFEVRNVVLRIDPSRTGLAATIQEAGLISVGARYIGDHQSAATWFAPSSPARKRR